MFSQSVVGMTLNSCVYCVAHFWSYMEMLKFTFVFSQNCQDFFHWKQGGITPQNVCVNFMSLLFSHVRYYDEQCMFTDRAQNLQHSNVISQLFVINCHSDRFQICNFTNQKFKKKNPLCKISIPFELDSLSKILHLKSRKILHFKSWENIIYISNQIFPCYFRVNNE